MINVTVFIKPKNWFDSETELKFVANTMDEANNVVGQLKEWGADIRNVVMFGEEDFSFTAHDDATSDGCKMCGNEWKSLNKQGYCSSCWTVWNS